VTENDRSRSRASVICLLVSASLAAACSSNPSSPSITTSSGPYSQTDLVVGTGTIAAVGNQVTVSYTGWFYNTAGPDGKGAQFDSSLSYPFVLGVGAVIRGWDQGVQGMRVGGQRRLIIPPELAYGSGGFLSIPPNATLVFDINLLNVR
jgi:FKBP-type peptidyl-prolyl cis-trans isomerase